MKIVTKKTIKKECWNLDYELVKWLNEHLKVYLADANHIVDLDWPTFTIKNKKMTFRKAIERLIKITDKLLEDDGYFNYKHLDYKNEMYDILKEIHYQLWW